MASWILFRLMSKPYYDFDGRILHSIKGRRNRFGIDEIAGGGLIYPDLTGYKISARHENRTTLLVEIDADPASAAKLVVRNDVLQKTGTYRIKRNPKRRVRAPAKIMVYSFQDFRPRILTDAEAEQILKDWGIMLPNPPESGVTQ